ASKAGRTALWLGPDEWLVIDEVGKDPLADCAEVTVLHSAVGISHRNVAISVTGPAAVATINSGCPQDLSLDAFPAGAASRTILGKVEIVLLRTASDAFRVECWRSF
ncbi:MAG: sarcosine oxidase subunit gamma, partial [Mesorhizobium sp.]